MDMNSTSFSRSNNSAITALEIPDTAKLIRGTCGEGNPCYQIIIMMIIIIIIIIIIITYSMAQQPLKSSDHPLMRVSLSNSILVTLIFY